MGIIEPKETNEEDVEYSVVLTYEDRLYELAKEYTAGDIRRILDHEIDAAGLLLLPVFSGMIVLGRLLYGFDVTDKEAFCAFASREMEIEAIISEVLFDNIYCGLIKQWMSGAHITLVAAYNRTDDAVVWVKEGAKRKGLVFNAVELADRYLAYIEQSPHVLEAELCTWEHRAIMDAPIKSQVSKAVDFIEAGVI